MNEAAMKAASFRELRIWREATALAAEIYRLTALFPRTEIFSMTSQLRRSASSVAANIAEGTGRRTTKDYEHFLFMARGSLRETMSHLELAKVLNFFDTASTEKTLSRYQGLDAGINACVRNLKKWQEVRPKTPDLLTF